MYSIELLEVMYRYNIHRDEIVQRIEDWFSSLLKDFQVNIPGVIPCYYKRTWGSCRRWQLILFEGDEPVWRKYSGSVEWFNNSSRKNANKLAVVPLNIIDGKELVIYMKEQPSCNMSRWWSLKAKIVIHKLPAETIITDNPRLLVENNVQAKNIF